MKANAQAQKTIKFSKEISIATASSRTAKSWRNSSTTIKEFVEKLSQTIRTQESIAEFMKMPKAQQDDIKDVGAFVGGTLKGGRRRKQDVANRHILTLDLDFAKQETIQKIKDVLKDVCFTVYSTHKHLPEKPRYRLIVYPDRVLFPDEYQAVMRKMAEKINMDAFDDTSYDVNRLFFWPSTPVDVDYVFYHNDQPFMVVDDVLLEYGPDDAWKDISLWPRSNREQQTFERMFKKQADPLEKKGIVGAFCRTVDIYAAIETYLSDVYRKEGADRYTYLEGTSAKGLVVYDGKFAYSNHASDPACGQCCNAFDLIRIHKFGYMDEKTRDDMPSTKLPSYKEMVDWARGVDGVKADLIKNNLEIDASAFDDFDNQPESDWLAELQTTDKGDLKPTLVNAIRILRYDPAINKQMKYNDFSMAREYFDGTAWNGEHSLNIREYVGVVYQVDFPESKIEDAIKARAYENRYHPVREYLTSLKWDGQERIEKLFINYFGEEDTAYTREVAKCMFSAAVHRIFEPGYKFDYVVVLGGKQGIRKTTFIRELGLVKWYGELSTFDSKMAMEEISGKWIVEISELNAINKQELEQQKSFLSSGMTRVRMAYERHPTEFLRQCIFIGSTNQATYLKDTTGNRRWWPIDCNVEEIDTDKLVEERDQIWAEAYNLWAQSQPVFLSKDAEKLAQKRQNEKMEDDEWQGIIESWLAEEAPLDRYDSKVGSFEENIKGVRERVCVPEIWEDCFGMTYSPRKFERNRIAAIMDNMPGWSKGGQSRFGVRFGKQRYWRNETPF